MVSSMVPKKTTNPVASVVSSNIISGVSLKLILYPDNLDYSNGQLYGSKRDNQFSCLCGLLSHYQWRIT